MQDLAHVPPRVERKLGTGTDRADAIIAAMRRCMPLDEWQERAVHTICATKDGRWAARNVGLIVPRQNGKNVVLAAIELYVAGVMGRTVIHTAHEAKTSYHHLVFLEDIGREYPADIEKVRTGNNQIIQFGSGGSIRFIARSRQSGRGFHADMLVCDEAFDLPQETIAALLPTMSTREDPLWVCASSVPANTTIESESLIAMRSRENVGWVEWSAPQSDGELSGDIHDPRIWRIANPSPRISDETIAAELAVMDAHHFAAERLGVWPGSAAVASSPISSASWEMAPVHRHLEDPVALAVEMSADGTVATIVAAGRVTDEVTGVEVAAVVTGASRTVDTLADLVATHHVHCVAVDGGGRASAIVRDLARSIGIDMVRIASGRDVVRACCAFADRVRDGRVSHLRDAVLTASALRSPPKQVAGGFVWVDGGGDAAAVRAAALAVDALTAAHGDPGLIGHTGADRVDALMARIVELEERVQQ